MDRDIFEKEIGAQLRRAEAPVPEGAWEAISSEIGGGTGSSGFGFIGAAAAGALMLGSLVVYSTFFGPDSDVISEGRSAKTEQTAQVSTSSNDVKSPEADDIEIKSESLATPSTEKEAGKTQTTDLSASGASSNVAPDAAVKSADDRGPRGYDAEQKRIASRTTGSDILLPESIPASGITTPVAADIERPAVVPATGSVEPLRASIRAENLKGYAPFEIDFEAFGNFEEVEWDFGPFGHSAEVKTSRTFDNTGTYTVMLTAYGEGGAIVTDMVTIEVREGSNLVVPDSFTPNGDGINDTFKAEGVNLASYQLSVTDARGNVVFETRNIDEPWVFNGIPGSEMEAYFAIIRAEGVDGKTYKVRQRINIIY